MCGRGGGVCGCMHSRLRPQVSKLKSYHVRKRYQVLPCFLLLFFCFCFSGESIYLCMFAYTDFRYIVIWHLMCGLAIVHAHVVSRMCVSSPLSLVPPPQMSSSKPVIIPLQQAPLSTQPGTTPTTTSIPTVSA